MVQRKVIGIFFVVFFGFLLSAHADEWAKTYGGSSLDYVNSIRQTADGGFIVGGAYNQCPWVSKIDGSGTIEWQKLYPTSYASDVSSIQQTADGGYIMLTGGIARGPIVRSI